MPGDAAATLFDTNILIYHANGQLSASHILANTPYGHISRITWLEVMAYIDDSDARELNAAQAMMAMLTVIEISPTIALTAVSIYRERVNVSRRQHGAIGKFKIPDAIIHATALHAGCRLVTNNVKDFKPVSFMTNIDVISMTDPRLGERLP